jgi:molybdate transport system substrate-binding protein
VQRRFGNVVAVTAAVAALTAATAIRGGVAASLGSRAPTGAITISAAASLSDAFTEIGKQFERKHPGVDVVFNFDASSALVLQIQAGAPVDVFASADEANMEELVSGGQVEVEPVDFARNRLEIAVKPGNPEHVHKLSDLATVGIVSLCASQVPCGKYADAALVRAGVDIDPDRITRGQNATTTLTAVSAGDADAAIVYVTDVSAAGASVEGVKIPNRHNEIATYPIAALADAANPKGARAFARYVASPAGEKVLRKHGFLVPGMRA